MCAKNGLSIPRALSYSRLTSRVRLFTTGKDWQPSVQATLLYFLPATQVVYVCVLPFHLFWTPVYLSVYWLQVQARQRGHDRQESQHMSRSPVS